MTSSSEVRQLGRRPALDGVRGVAALVVVVHHTLLTDPVLASPYGGQRAESAILLSPLRLLWAGDVAVAVFFVLSGYVLARPRLVGDAAPWRSYYAKRLLRLYLPVVAAVLLAAAIVMAIPRSSDSGRSWWVDMQAMTPSLTSVMGDATLLRVDELNNALWSLKWEVVFSAMLPVYVWAVVWLRRFPAWVGVASMLLMTTAGTVTMSQPLQFLPVFGLGALVAAYEPRMIRATAGWAGPHWVAVAVVAIALTTPMIYPLQALGATVVVVVVVAWPWAAGEASRSLPLALGRASYSLYLVHLPIVMAIAAMLASWPAWALLPVTVPAALLAAVFFHRLVEAPAQRVASAAAARLRRDRLAAEPLAVVAVPVSGE